MSLATPMRPAGTSPGAIARHYDLPHDFFALWLGDERVYSCALWEDGEDPRQHLLQAQRRKLDYFARALTVGGCRVLDIGCGWGALLARFASVHRLGHGVGLTLSEPQAAFATTRRVPHVEYRAENWIDHVPEAPYDAITCIEATEHWASDAVHADGKVEAYRHFFSSCSAWLKDGGRLGLQLICLDNVGHEGSRAGRGPASELIRVDIFPESMPASLSEMVLAWESDFRLVSFVDHHEHYARTFRAWNLAYRERRGEARDLGGEANARTFARYLAAGEVFFRRREHSLYRVVLEKRPRRKHWAMLLKPSDVADLESQRVEPPDGAAPDAIRFHYDVSNDFYRLWLGPTMMYTSGYWPEAEPAAPVSNGTSRSNETFGRTPGSMTGGELDSAVQRKIDFFADRVLVGTRGAVLDVGCGWGHTLRRLVERHGVRAAVGLTLSAAQYDFIAARPAPRTEVRLEDWRDHRPREAYEAIVCFGAFEHFARADSTAVQRVAAYRRFFATCYDWLAQDGRVGLETIAHDGAPETADASERGPLSDAVLSLYPESICPQLCDIVLGFEPYFEIEVLRADADDFATTCRAWLVALRANESKAADLVGAETVARFRRYLVSSEVQFRSGAITNYRIVLHRRPELRW